MRLAVLASLIFLATLPIASGQTTSGVYSNYRGSLSHLEGVGVVVRYTGKKDRREMESKIGARVRSEIRSARGVRLYTSEDRKDFKRNEESRPVLRIRVYTFRSNEWVINNKPRQSESYYEIKLDVEQDAIIKGTDQEIRADTYSVFGDPDRKTYRPGNVDPDVMAQRALIVMVRQFIEDFRRSKSD